MKIGLYSDLHLDLLSPWSWKPPELDWDVVILAGDISARTQGLAWARDTFRARPNPPQVVYVAGNHEYYGAHLGLLAEMQQPNWKDAGVHFLERDVLTLPGLRILGCTLWSGFDLYGRDQVDQGMKEAQHFLNDYRLIATHDGQRLRPVDTRKLYQKSALWLEQELSKPFEGKTVVVTHFAPHRGCIDPQYVGDSLTPYFVTDMSAMMGKHEIDLWCFGHTHCNVDFIAEGRCRVLSNQRGYRRETKRGNRFLDELVIELL